MASSSSASNLTEDKLIKTATNQWKKINKALKCAPKFQNENVPSVTEESIKDFESKLKLTLPEEIRAVIRVHNGRKHIGFGLGFRSPTTDLLPLSEWKPYEIDNDELEETFFECLTDDNYASALKNLREDAQEHLKVYKTASGKGQKRKSEDTLTQSKKFRSLPSELLIIGRGMDDYAEQYILSVRSGRIYLAIHNIPEWRLIGTFQDWIKESLSYIKDQKDDIKEQHDEAEVD